MALSGDMTYFPTPPRGCQEFISDAHGFLGLLKRAKEIGADADTIASINGAIQELCECTKYITRPYIRMSE